MTEKPVPRRAPPPIRKPGQVKVVRAMYPYTAQQADELSFDEGDTLYILDMSDSGWWKAKHANITGLIPSNYVEQNMESIDFPLHDAAKRGNLDFMTECINNRVSVNGLDKAGSTPLYWASHGGHMECVQTLLDVTNCDLNTQNKLGDTPLHSAAWRSHPHVVEVLLEKGADPAIKNKDGKTAYDLAKDADVAAMIRQQVSPQLNSGDYGDEEDSD